ncbi:MAG TPA: CorA family divalent cation transporter [Methylomirabilota bacterium]|nr:CorA family divalent cation transporter [Methylomirabilota bacterium]
MVGIRALLYDAKGEDSKIELTRRAVTGLRDDQLLWVDLEQPGGDDLNLLGEAFAFPAPIMTALARPGDAERLVRSPEAILLTVVSVEERDGQHAPLAVDIVATRNAVATIHTRPVPALDEFESHVSDEGALGQLDAGSFMGALVDTMLGAFRREVEEIEEQVDRLDEVALRGNDPAHFLERVVALRRRAAILRRILVPQRETFGPLTRPDFDLHEDLGKPWPGLVDQLEKAISGVERARELLVGSSDIYLGRLGQRANDVMKALTILSAVLLPAVVLAGVMGMNFKLGFFDQPGNFWYVVLAMLGLAALILGFARIRRWI